MAKKEVQIPMMVVTSKMKEYTKPSDVNVSGDFADALNKVIAGALDEAVRRCKANGRKTLRADDL